MPTKPRFKACVLAIAIAALPLFTQAAGLGRLNVMSGLGQPFRGEIDLVAVQPGEVESLRVGLASVEAHSAAQLTYPSPALGLRLALNKRSDGQYVVQISSAGALDEPVFNLLVDLTWSGGKIQREYTALIDPTGYSGVQAGTQTSPVSNATVSRLAPNALPGTLVSSAIRQPKVAQRPVRAVKAASASAPANFENDYAVKAGDTLSNIAARVKPEGVSLEQVLVGLYQANQDAFDGNMNRLKRGKILHIPTEDAFGAVSKVEAAKEIKMHSADWQSYRHQLASAAVKIPAADSGAQATGGRITAKVEDKGLQAPSKDKDVLKLSRGGGSDDQTNKIRALEEDAAARKKALDEANQRVTELQKNIKQMEEFAALKSKSGAELQQKAEQGKASAPVAGFSQPDVAASAPVASAVVTASPDAEQAKPKKRVIPPPPPAPEPSITDILMENAVPVGGGIAAILLGVGGLIWSRRRRQPNVFENSLISNGDLKPNTVLGRTGGGVISTQAENSFLTDFSRQGLGTIDTDEVDPIAEADVYMAYGRDAQAEEILKDALVKDPSRQEIRMKLLDIYAARKDKVAFEEVAADIYAATDGKGPLWEQAAYQGHNLDPENALYAKKFGASAAAAPSVALAGVAAAAAVATADVVPTEPAAQEEGLDTLSQEDEGILDFEFEMPDVEPEQVPEPVAAISTAAGVDLAEVDLDLDWESMSALEPVEPEVLPGATAAAIALTESNVPPDAPDEMLSEREVEEDDSGLMALDLPIDLGHEFDVALPPIELEAAAPVNEIADLDEEVAPQFDVASFELPDLDLNLDEVAEAQAIADFNAQLSVNDEAELSSPELAPADDEAALDEMDEIDLKFDFSMDEAVAEADVSKSAMPIDLGLEIGSIAESADFAVDDPVQTKIDLARAYIDMGDVEGAREILQEAEQEGSLAQQDLAKLLLAEL